MLSFEIGLKKVIVNCFPKMKATNTILGLTKILAKYVDENTDFDKSGFKVENWGWKNIKHGEAAINESPPYVLQAIFVEIKKQKICLSGNPVIKIWQSCD